jgi:DNA-binding transcriptional LysR family regulator
MSYGDELHDLAVLELLVSAVELGSMSQAAARHHLTQPAVSMRLARLERRVGLHLLQRAPTGCKPTREGQAVVEWARDLLDHASRVGAAIEALRVSRRGRLAIAASLTIAEQLLPGWLSNVPRQAPSAEISVTVTNSEEVVELVRRDAVGLGFIESDDEVDRLRVCEVGQDRLVVAVAPQHPWRRRRSPLQPHHLADTPMVLRESGSGTRSTFEHALQAAGHSPAPPLIELNSTAAIRSAVSEGLAPTVISELSIRDDVAAGRLVVVPTTGISLDRKFRAIWRGTAPRFLAIVRELD